MNKQMRDLNRLMTINKLFLFILKMRMKIFLIIYNSPIIMLNIDRINIANQSFKGFKIAFAKVNSFMNKNTKMIMISLIKIIRINKLKIKSNQRIIIKNKIEIIYQYYHK